MDENLYEKRVNFLNTSFGTNWKENMNITDSDIKHGTFWNNEYRTPWGTWYGTIPDDIKGPKYSNGDIYDKLLKQFGYPCRTPVPGSFYYDMFKNRPDIASNFYNMHNKNEKRLKEKK